MLQEAEAEDCEDLPRCHGDSLSKGRREGERIREKESQQGGREEESAQTFVKLECL